MKGQNENKQDKKGKLKRSNTCPSQKPPKRSHPSEPNLAQTRSLQRRWACFRSTHSGEPNHT